MKKPVACAVLLGVVGLGSVAWAAGSSPVMSRAEVNRRVEAMTALGRKMFFDASLSASGKMACATCHSPDHFFGPPNDLAVMLGGKDMKQPGVRAVPSLMYLQAVPQFTEHYYESDDEGDESIDNGPTGGLTWDGRADSGAEQAKLPLLSPLEMANDGPTDVVKAVKAAPYAAEFRAVFGARVFDDTAAAFAGILKSFEVFEQDYKTFYPYSSKYDAYLAGKATLSPQEMRGLEAFNDPKRGNCALCHVSKVANDGEPPQFTDYGLIPAGVPRNPEIPANKDAAYYDMGVCGPYRSDMSTHKDYCGLFATPTLRNVMTRGVFFHNGIYHNMKDVMEFYAKRDTDPELFYPRKADGTVDKFNDLPPELRENVDSDDPPFDRKLGDKPSLTESEMDDIIVFMKTLTDGYFVPWDSSTRPVTFSPGK